MSCASSKVGSQKSTFKTKVTETNFSINSNGLANPAKVSYQVRAQCEGSNCIPDEAQLSFHLRSGTNKVYLSNRNLTIQVEEETYNWPGREWSNIYNSPPVLGVIKTITLDWNTLTTIAKAQEVTGNLAGQSFEWTHKNREPIRAIVSEAESESGAQE